MFFMFLVLILHCFSTLEAKVSKNSLKDELFILTSQNHQSYSYQKVRKFLFNTIHLQKDESGHYVQGVYCEKKIYPFQGEHPGQRLPDHRVMNTEHTWPQSKFSQAFSREVQKTDLHHLYPTLSRINAQRGNLPFAEVYHERELSCEGPRSGRSIVGGEQVFFEPPARHKGNVARSLFYFSIRYKLPLDSVQEDFLRSWHRLDPVDEEERKRNEMIFSLQKNRNPFIDRPELVSRITDF